MNFLHLKYFLLVAEELNITRAAERLYISQQSLSNHISNMEKELDVKLFTRSPKLSLTYAGDLLVETATQILDLHSQYLAKVGDINRHYMGLLRLGISHTCGLALLPDILPKFQAEFPMVEFSLFEGNSTHLEDELAHGRVDLIICFQPIMMEGVEVVPLTEEELILVVPKIFTDQLFGDRAEEVRAQFASGADIDVFQHQPFILIKRGNRTRNTVDQYFSRHFFKPKLILETENTITTLAMAEAGIGITICPELFLKTIHVTANQASTEKLDLFPLTDPSTISKLVVGYRRDRYLSHFGERFIQLTQQALLPPIPFPAGGAESSPGEHSLSKALPQEVPPPRLKPGRAAVFYLSSGAVDGPQLRGDPLPRQQILHSDKAEPTEKQLIHDLDGGVHRAVVDVMQEDDVPVLHLIRHGGNDAGDVVILPVLRIY